MVLSLNKLHIHYLKDSVGERTVVQIPIKEWQSLEKEYQRMAAYFQLRDELKAAFEEVNDMKNGLVPKKTLKEFLDEN